MDIEAGAPRAASDAAAAARSAEASRSESSPPFWRRLFQRPKRLPVRATFPARDRLADVASRCQEPESAGALAAALAAQQCDSCGDAAGAPFTSRKLLRCFKALAFFALLATTGVGAGVAYWLGAHPK